MGSYGKCLLLLFALSGQVQAAGFRAGQLIYQIYPRAFYDGSAQPNGQGNLRGLELKLDYLSSLGVDQILLMPLHESQDQLGYIPRDLFSIAADYGSTADLQALVQAAHKKNMSIIIDSPINHMADDSNWVKQAIRKSCDPWDSGYRADDPNLKYCQYFYQIGNPWNDEPYRQWHKPWDWEHTSPSDVWHRIYGYNPAFHRNAYHYSSFSPNMIDLKYYDPSQKKWNNDLIADIDRYITAWVNIGIDGFRIDAAKHLVEGDGRNDQAAEPHNLQLMAHFRQTLQKLKPEAPLIGEIWDSYPVMYQYLNAGAIDGFFDFGFMGSLRESISSGNAQNFSGNMAYLEQQMDAIRIEQQIVTMGNHDVSRVMTEFKNNDAAVTQAFFALLSSPFPALIYYGDEVGMEGLVKRPTATDPREFLQSTLAFPWHGESPMFGFPGTIPPRAGSPSNARVRNLSGEEGDPTSIYQVVRSLITLRKTLKPEGTASIKVLSQSHPRIFAYAWPKLGGGCYASFMNFDHNREQTMAWPTLPTFCGQANPRVLWQKTARFDAKVLTLPPYGQLLVEWPAVTTTP